MGRRSPTIVGARKLRVFHFKNNPVDFLIIFLPNSGQFFKIKIIQFGH